MCPKHSSLSLQGGARSLWRSKGVPVKPPAHVWRRNNGAHGVPREPRAQGGTQRDVGVSQGCPQVSLPRPAHIRPAKLQRCFPSHRKAFSANDNFPVLWKTHRYALAGWSGGWNVSPQKERSQVRFPARARAWVAVASLLRVRETPLMGVSLSCQCFRPSLPLVCPLPLKPRGMCFHEDKTTPLCDPIFGLNAHP